MLKTATKGDKTATEHRGTAGYRLIDRADHLVRP